MQRKVVFSLGLIIDLPRVFAFFPTTMTTTWMAQEAGESEHTRYVQIFYYLLTNKHYGNSFLLATPRFERGMFAPTTIAPLHTDAVGTGRTT